MRAYCPKTIINPTSFALSLAALPGGILTSNTAVPANRSDCKERLIRKMFSLKQDGTSKEVPSPHSEE